MAVPGKTLAAAALLAMLAGCGGPPDDVADAARQTRTASAQSRAAAEAPQRAASAQRDRTASPDVRPSQRGLSRELPPVGSARAPAAKPAATPGATDRSTAVMGAGPASEAAAGPAQHGEPAVPVDDAVITSRVRGVLTADREIGALHVDVDTRDGIVTLSGTVPTAGARARAGDLAKSVKDVRSVNDQLTLETG